MMRFLVLAARLEPSRRWLACGVLWVFISMAGFVFFTRPRIIQLKNVQSEISAKEKQLELEKAKGKELAALEKEVQTLRLEKEKKEQELRQSQDFMKSKAAEGTPYMVSFFSNLAQSAKDGGAKFVSIRPVDETPSGDEKKPSVKAGQKSVDVFLIGTYSILSYVLNNLERTGALTTIRKFHIKPGQKGYPLLELQMRLDVLLG